MAATNHGCDQFGCKGYYAYIRFKKKWIKIGAFHSKCKSFILFDEININPTGKVENPQYCKHDFYDLITREDIHPVPWDQLPEYGGV